MTVDIADGRVHTVRSIINPAKLRHLGPPADISAVFETATITQLVTL